jgi:hypothetical protein
MQSFARKFCRRPAGPMMDDGKEPMSPSDAQVERPPDIRGEPWGCGRGVDILKVAELQAG